MYRKMRSVLFNEKHLEGDRSNLLSPHTTLPKLRIVLFDNAFAKLLTRRKDKRKGQPILTAGSLTGGAQ